MKKESSSLNFEKALQIKNNVELIKSISHKQNAFDLLKKNPKLILWIKMDEKNYKLYFINGISVEFSDIINLDKFKDEDRNKLIDKITELKLNDDKKVIYNKSYIDYINIIYSYIYKNEKINYIQL